MKTNPSHAAPHDPQELPAAEKSISAPVTGQGETAPAVCSGQGGASAVVCSAQGESGTAGDAHQAQTPFEGTPSGRPSLSERILGQLKSHVVLLVAIVAAAVTCFFVPPDAGYADYFDLNTLSCLFCTLAVVSALKERHFFEWLSGKIVTAFGNMRRVTFALVFVTYFGSMIMANDMALVTFLPLGYYVLSSCNKPKYTAFVFVMQNVAANLGGMLTPFGNPQNLYLYSYYSIAAADFFAIMALPFAVAFVLIAGTCFVIKPEPVRLETPPAKAPVVWRMVVYFVLFALSVMIVFRVFPWYVGAISVTLALLILEPRSFLRVDYGLLLTFCAFFIFSGNLARIPEVRAFLSALVGASALLVGTASCQVISNVPSAVLLSRFTNDYRSLLVAVNIGGLGTPVASLASLITLGEFRRRRPGHTGKYLALFSLINFSFLAVLIGTGFLNGLIFA